MPYFEVKTNLAVESETKDALCRELGRIVELIPGKSADWVMTHLEDRTSLHFSGDSAQPAALVFFRSMGDLEAEYYDLLTAEICASVNKLLDIDPKRVYVIYASSAHWGWDGKNF